MSNCQKCRITKTGRLLSGVLAFVFLVLITGFGVLSTSVCNAESSAGFITGGAPALNISPAVVEYKPKAKVFISGSGFKPNTEIGLRIFMGGAITNIAYLVKPPVKINELGAFAGVWTLNQEISKKILEPIAYTIMAVDSNAKQLASAPLVLALP